MIHRDLKAENMVLEHGSGRALVTDFGIAHVTSQLDITGRRQFVGTVAHMSPELAAAREISEAVDRFLARRPEIRQALHQRAGWSTGAC